MLSINMEMILLNYMKMEFELHDKVVKNDENWIPNDFDGWGRGEGVGEVVEIFPEDSSFVDVRWEGGRCYEFVSQIKKLE